MTVHTDASTHHGTNNLPPSLFLPSPTPHPHSQQQSPPPPPPHLISCHHGEKQHHHPHTRLAIEPFVPSTATPNTRAILAHARFPVDTSRVIGFDHLPHDVVVSIADYLPPGSMASLAATKRYYYNLLIPRLYRTVVIRRTVSAHTVAFLANHPSVAARVQVLKLPNMRSGPAVPPLCSLPNLKVLAVNNSRPASRRAVLAAPFTSSQHPRKLVYHASWCFAHSSTAWYKFSWSLLGGLSHFILITDFKDIADANANLQANPFLPPAVVPRYEAPLDLVQIFKRSPPRNFIQRHIVKMAECMSTRRRDVRLTLVNLEAVCCDVAALTKRLPSTVSVVTLLEYSKRAGIEEELDGELLQEVRWLEKAEAEKHEKAEIKAPSGEGAMGAQE